MLKKSICPVLCDPKNIRVNFYINRMGDVSTKQEFSKQDLESIMLLDTQSTITMDLINQNKLFNEESNIYSLLAENVLTNHPTGADLGIYDYEPITQEAKKVDSVDTLKYSNYSGRKSIDNSRSSVECVQFSNANEWEDDYCFNHCILAEGSALSTDETQVIITFKGYLEVTKSEFSFIRKCDCDNSTQFSIVYIPEYYIRKYQLRNGDEIVCTCKENNGKMLLNSLLTINQISHYKWDCNRPWFNDLVENTKVKPITKSGSYTEALVKKFGLVKSDNVFVYINRNSQKAKVLDNIVNELSNLFDKVIYINPQNKSTKVLDSYNIVKFCAQYNDSLNSQLTVTLLGTNYAKRLIEMGKNIVIIIDDIDAIAELDNDFGAECPVFKTVLGCTKATTKGGITSFTLMSLRNDIVNPNNIHHNYRSAETLGVIIDNNEIDLYNSYRV